REDLPNKLWNINLCWTGLHAVRDVAEQAARRRFQGERRRKRRINICEVLFELLRSKLGARMHGDPVSMIGWKFRQHSIKSAIPSFPGDLMAFDALIKNGTVVTATDTYTADVAIVDGKIHSVGVNLPQENAARVFNAAGKYVMPGGIDVHTHLDMPFGGTTSADDFETGTRAAAFGGTTTLIDFAIQYKGQSLRTAFDTWMKKASQKAVCDYAFHCIITELGDTQLKEMNALVREGVTSFKLFMAYPGVFMLDDASIFKALQTTAKN